MAKDSSISRAGFDPELGAARAHTYFRLLPSKIRADHYSDNHDRAALYSLAAELPELAGHPAFADDRFCFRRSEVLDRADSFRAIGQEQAIKVYRSHTKQADLGAGFLRHAAGLYLEVTGQLASCPEMAKGLSFSGEEQPKSPLAAVAKNRGENERKETTPIDKAWLAKRYETLGHSRLDIAAALGLDKRSVDRLFQLLGLSPAVQLDVHEGRTSMMKALNAASAAGKGSAKGPRSGVKHSQLRSAIDHAHARPLPDVGLSAKDTATLVALIAGAVSVDDETPQQVVEWYRAITPTREEIKDLAPKRETKLDPPKPGRILTGVAGGLG